MCVSLLSGMPPGMLTPTRPAIQPLERTVGMLNRKPSASTRPPPSLTPQVKQDRLDLQHTM